VKTQFESAIIEEQGKKFAVVYVQPVVFNNATDGTMIIKALLPVFSGIPIILVTKNKEGAPAYYGRPDLVLLLDNININDATWSQVSADIELSNDACPSNEGIKIET